jgi:hypothetical protein
VSVWLHAFGAKVKNLRIFTYAPLLHHNTDITTGNGSHLPIHFSQKTFKNSVIHQKKNNIVGKRFLNCLV